jgi:hypothetical protein
LSFRQGKGVERCAPQRRAWAHGEEVTGAYRLGEAARHLSHSRSTDPIERVSAAARGNI